MESQARRRRYIESRSRCERLQFLPAGRRPHQFDRRRHVSACIVQVLEAEAVALLEQLRGGGGGGGWSILKRGLSGAWGRPPTPRLLAARQVPEPSLLLGFMAVSSGHCCGHVSSTNTKVVGSNMLCCVTFVITASAAVRQVVVTRAWSLQSP